MVGVTQAATGEYIWNCICGAASDVGQTNREDARAAYRLHRTTCPSAQGDAPQPEEKKVMSGAKGKAPTKGAKKPAAEKKVKETKPAVTDAQAKAAFARIQKGESSVIKEAKALGFKDRIQLRKAIVALVGKAQYAAALAADAKKKKDKPKVAKPAKVKAERKEPVAEATTAEVAQ